MDDRTVAGVVFDFAAFLTTLDSAESFPVGANHDAAPMPDAIKKWADERGISIDDVNHEWQEQVKRITDKETTS